jgi:uncharacterized protein (DUF305 family)
VKDNPRRATERIQDELTSKGAGGFWILVLALVLLLGVVAGTVLTLLLAVDQAPDGESAEAGFARDMSVHHAQAVEMSEIVRDRTESEEMRTLAADIALTQQGQIGQMEGWLAVWGLPATRTGPAMAWMGHSTEGRMPGMASSEEVEELREAPPEEMDVRFLQLMIPHHEAAIPMAEAALDHSDRPEVERLAGAISASQEAEIQAMQGLLQSRGVPVEETPPASDENHHGDHGHGG